MSPQLFAWLTAVSFAFNQPERLNGMTQGLKRDLIWAGISAMG